MWPISAAGRNPYLPLIGRVRAPCLKRLNGLVVHSFRGGFLLSVQLDSLESLLYEN